MTFKKTRVLYLITRSDQIGGAHIHVRDIALSAQSQGFEVLVAVGGQGFYIDELLRLDVNTCSVPFLSRRISLFDDFRSLLYFYRLCRKFQPDIISSHSAKAGVISRLLKPFFPKTAFLFPAHGWSFAVGIPKFVRIYSFVVEYLLARFCDKIICVCDSDRDLALELSLCSPRKLIVIHNGMANIALPNTLNTSPSCVRICCVARFEDQKDHASLLHSLSCLKDYRWRLDLVGDGMLLPDIKKLCHDLDIIDCVTFHGRLNDVIPILSDSDIFVLPSFWEGFPRSILEAMRSSLPIIATDVGGVGEAVIDGWNGFLVPSSVITGTYSWVSPLKTLFDFESLRIEFGKNSRTLYVNNFTLDRTVSKTLSVYSDVLK